MSIDIEELTAVHDAEVEEFLNRLSLESPAVLAYHYPFYRDMLVESGVGRPLFLGARLGADLVGLLPALVRETEVGTAICSLPFFGPNAGVICNESALTQSIHAALIGELLTRARAARALSCAVYTPLMFTDFSQYDAFTPTAAVEKFTQHNDVVNSEWNGFIRNRLRRAERLDVTITTENTPTRFDEFYAIYSENCGDYGIPLKPKTCVEKLLSPALQGRRSQVYYALQQDQMIGALLLMKSPSTVSYYIPCTRHDARNLQPGTLLVDRAFRDARAEGARVWNWESSPSRESGVYEYKRKWGAVESSYRIYVWCPRGVDALRRIGSETLVRSFPYFFIFPFNQLEGSAAA